MRHPVRVRLLLRILVLGVALPAVYIGGASAAFYYRERLVNESVNVLKLPKLQPPDSLTRLMVFAPHCDDETLGSAGLIQQTLAAGGHVEAVIITNGDGYPAAVERQQRVLKATPKEFIRFAALRQAESVNAMHSLGLDQNRTLFLGYPDQGLSSLWTNNWNEDKPYVSNFTQCDKSPYGDTFNTESTYCGSDLLRDLRAVMTRFRPTIVIASHPAEDHPDHAAAANFITLALQQLQDDPVNRGWSSRTRLYHYMIHRGDWPTPQGVNPDLPLAPPAAMMSVDTDWSSLPLSASQVQKKATEISAYPSQTSIMPGFLSSFARSNEIFGSIAHHVLPIVSGGVIPAGASNQRWEGISPCIQDPARDNVLRDLQGGGDLLAIYCARDTERLYLRLKLRCDVSPRFTYIVRIRPFGPDWSSPDSAVQVELKAGNWHKASDGSVCWSNGRNIDVEIPWFEIAGSAGGAAIRAIALSAETKLSSVQIDRSETRLLMTSLTTQMPRPPAPSTPNSGGEPGP